ELTRFHFQKRRIRQLRQAPRDFRLTDTRWADHEDVLRHYLLGHFGVQLLAADAVAQRDRDRPLRVRLPDYVLVELAYNFARRQLIKQRRLVVRLPGKINDHKLAELLEDEILIRVNTDFARDAHRLLHDLARFKLSVLDQSRRRRLCKWAARSNRRDFVVRFDHVTVSAYDVSVIRVGHQQQGFQVPQYPVGPPFFCKLDYRPRQIAVVLFQLRFKTRKKRERVRRRSRESR